ncbi:MAG: S16 family serine protease [Candidatus Woesearchaeota archaeon]
MKNFKLFLLGLFIFIFGAFSVFSYSNSMYLLATTQNGTDGGLAEAHVEITPGEGRVFVESYPVPKTDTLLSVRYAKDLACQYTYRDCSNYDFFYFIEANSPFVEGPSAGAALTVLTIFSLENKTFPDDVSVTGTINSGGIIGLVGGIPSKIDAAKNAGLNEVYIPGVSLLSNRSEINVYDLPTFKVKPINTINEMIKEILGDKAYNVFEEKISERKIQIETEIESGDEYYRLMEEISDFMCERTNSLANTLNDSISSSCIKINEEDIPKNWDDILKDSFENYLRKITYELISNNENVSFSNFSDVFNNLSSDYNLDSFYNKNEDYLTQTDIDLESFFFDLNLTYNLVHKSHFKENISFQIEKYHKSFNFVNELSFNIFEKLNFHEKINFIFLSRKNKITYLAERINEFNNSLLGLDEKLLCKNPIGSLKNIDQRYQSSLKMDELNNYYSKASFCYSANVELSQNYFYSEMPNIKDLIDDTNRTYLELREVLDNKDTKNYFDFQARMISNDRLIEAKENLDKSIEIYDGLKYDFEDLFDESDFNFSKINNLLNDDLYNLTYEKKINDSMRSNYIESFQTNYFTKLVNYQSITHSVERLEGIKGWFILFDSNVGDRELDENILRRSCLEKISQSEERFHSISNYLPDYSDKSILNRAYKEYRSEDYVNCIYQASMAKASYDLVLGTMGIENKNIVDLINIRLPVAKKIIDDSQDRGFFPIMGYNYYEYAMSLKDSDEFSSLIYSEYAIELSSLDMFFYEGMNLSIGNERKVCMNNNLTNRRDNIIRFVLIFSLIIFVLLSFFLIFELSKIKELKKYVKSKEKYDKEETVVRIDE